MKHKFYQFIQIAVLLILSSFSALALENSAIENYRSTVVRDNEGKVQKYSVLVSNVGDPKNNSDFSEHYVQRVDPKYYAKGQIYVKTKHKTDKGKDYLLQGASALTSALQSIGSTKITAFADANQVAKNPGMQKYGLDRLYTITIPAEEDPFEVCAELMNNPDVEYACPVSAYYKFEHKTNDPKLIMQYALKTMKVFEAWEFSKGSPDIKIAIVDSGVDYEHPDLAAHIWTNPNEIPDDGIDNDGNGKVDDYRGWDFLANKDAESIYRGEIVEDNDPMNKVFSHGTEVAGCVGAVPNNNEGIAGVAYNCKLIPVKIHTDIPNLGHIDMGFEAIVYAANLGADIINCSWGVRGYSPAYQDMVNYAVLEKNAIVLAGVGNDATDIDENGFYPASFMNVISVGAINDSNDIAYFSNYGYAADVFAPGTEVLSTSTNGTYRIIQGTSFSSPYVAGVVALVKAIHPDWTPKKINQHINSTCDIVRSNRYQGQYFRLINALKAVTYNSDNSDITVPCINAEKAYINNDKTKLSITDTNVCDVNIEIKNYLSTTKNLKIKLSSLDGVLDIIDSEYLAEIVNSDSIHTISFKVKVSEQSPWSRCNTRMMLEYEGENGNYKDYQIVKMYINLPSDNQHNYASKKGVIKMMNISEAIDTKLAWGAGDSFGDKDYAFKYDASRRQIALFDFPNLFAPKAMAAVDENNAFFAIEAPIDFPVTLLITNDGGKTFKEGRLGEVMYRINALLFKDNNNGLAIGFTKNKELTIVTTKDGGANWSNIQSAIPEISKDNTIYRKAHERINDCIYFATYSGEMFKSEDFGKTWTQKANLPGPAYSIAFLDENTGMVIIKGNEIAITKGGGNSWSIAKNVLPQKGEVKPVDILADRKNRSFIIVYSDGSIYKSDDLAESWKPIRRPKLNSEVQSSSIYVDENGEVAVFLLGEQAERVLYRTKKSSVEAISSKYKLSPNPAANSCQLFLGDDASKVETMQIYSSDGRMMMQITPNFNEGSTTINTSSLPVGQYNIVLMGRGIFETVKLIVTR